MKSRVLCLLMIGLLGLGGIRAEGREAASAPWKVILCFAAENNLRADYEERLAQLHCLRALPGIEVLILFDRGSGPCCCTCSARLPQPPGATLYRLGCRGLETLWTVPTWNTASGDFLRALLDEADCRAPSDRTALFLLDHGLGWYGSCNDAAGDTLVSAEIATALAGHVTRKGPVDLLAFASCEMGALEVLTPLARVAKHAVAGEDILWTHNWDLPAILCALSAKPASDGGALADVCLDSCPCVNDPQPSFRNARAYGPRQELSVLARLDLEHVGPLAERVSELGKALSAAILNDPKQVAEIRNARDRCMDFLCFCFGNAQGAACKEGRFNCQVDLAHLVGTLRRHLPQLASAEVDAVDAQVRRVVVRSTENPHFEGACGLGVQFPCHDCLGLLAGGYAENLSSDLGGWLAFLKTYLATPVRPASAPLHLRLSDGGGVLHSPLLGRPRLSVEGDDPRAFVRNGLTLEYGPPGARRALGWIPLRAGPGVGGPPTPVWPTLVCASGRTPLPIERWMPTGTGAGGYVLESRLRLDRVDGGGAMDVWAGLRFSGSNVALLYVAGAAGGGGRVPIPLLPGDRLTPHDLRFTGDPAWEKSMSFAGSPEAIVPGSLPAIQIGADDDLRVVLAPLPGGIARVIFGAEATQGEGTYAALDR